MKFDEKSLKLICELKRIKDNLSLTERMIKNYTDSWVIHQKEIIYIEKKLEDLQ